MAAQDGSSPLARGLPPGLLGPVVAAGIIPARAGFTPSGRSARRRGPDHPRSRGVYFSTDTVRAPTAGSSPLARGLRRRLRVRGRHPRIIPARAGFTYSCWRRRMRQRDHPRSRGVYLTDLTYTFGNLGSSPLARGLPGVRDPLRVACGIIPARAGFTRVIPTQTGRSPDHPRSRGVYRLS